MNHENINILLQEISDLLRQRDAEILLERLREEKEREELEFAAWVAHMESRYAAYSYEDQ